MHQPALDKRAGGNIATVMAMMVEALRKFL